MVPNEDIDQGLVAAVILREVVHMFARVLLLWCQERLFVRDLVAALVPRKVVVDKDLVVVVLPRKAVRHGFGCCFGTKRGCC